MTTETWYSRGDVIEVEYAIDHVASYTGKEIEIEIHGIKAMDAELDIKTLPAHFINQIEDAIKEGL